MDNVKVFDALDRKIEKLLGRLKQLETENEKLKSDLAAARKAETGAGSGPAAPGEAHPCARGCRGKEVIRLPRVRPKPLTPLAYRK
jgi:hypothetical protein